jgi:pyruvate/2-oxoglutarate dehydrogenase complex dihydrolipoamide dehydrogenase (E3) component
MVGGPAPKTLEVRLRDGAGMRVLTGQRIFLNLGTRATIPPTPVLADSKPLTHIEALELDRLPAHLIVLGGGYVGLELAQAYRRFGSRVTVVQYGPQLLDREDPDVADAIRGLFADEGIDVLVSAEAIQVEGRSGKGVRLRVRTPQGERLLEGSDILVATGRTPNTAGIGLEIAGVRLDARGYVQVNDRLETSVPGSARGPFHHGARRRYSSEPTIPARTCASVDPRCNDSTQAARPSGSPARRKKR